MHEHHVLCKALHLAQGYDQLALGNIASLELINRRRQLIESAHSGKPDAPSFEAADSYMGSREAADGSLVDESLNRHVSQREHARAEIMKQTRLARDERAAAAKAAADKKKGDKGAP